MSARCWASSPRSSAGSMPSAPSASSTTTSSRRRPPCRRRPCEARRLRPRPAPLRRRAARNRDRGDRRRRGGPLARAGAGVRGRPAERPQLCGSGAPRDADRRAAVPPRLAARHRVRPSGAGAPRPAPPAPRGAHVAGGHQRAAPRARAGPALVAGPDRSLAVAADLGRPEGAAFGPEGKAHSFLSPSTRAVERTVQLPRRTARLFPASLLVSSSRRYSQWTWRGGGPRSSSPPSGIGPSPRRSSWSTTRGGTSRASSSSTPATARRSARPASTGPDGTSSPSTGCSTRSAG